MKEKKNFKSLRTIISWLIIIVGLFYFSLFRIVLKYYFSQGTRFFNSIIIVMPKKDLYVRKAKMQVGDDIKDIQLSSIEESEKSIWFFQFHDILNIKGFVIDMDGEGQVWIGKKISIFKKPFLLIPLKKKDGNWYEIQQNSFTFKGLFFILFFFDIGFFLLTFWQFLKWFSLWEALTVIGGLFVSDIFILNNLDSFQGGKMKIVFWLGWLFDVFIGLGFLIVFLYNRRKDSFWGKRETLLSLITLLFFWNINSVSLRSFIQKTIEINKVIKNLFNQYEERARLSYEMYGAAYDVGLFIKKLLENSGNNKIRIALPPDQRIYPVMGNSDLMRFFLYPAEPIRSPIKGLDPKGYIDFWKKEQISYVLVVKEGMDSFAPWISWPTFSIPCEGIYIYSNGIITYIRENYNPRKYLKKDDTLVLIKLEEQK